MLLQLQFLHVQQAAVGCQHECGLPGKPLSLSWLGGQPKSVWTKGLNGGQRTSVTDDLHQPQTLLSGPQTTQHSSGGDVSGLHKDSDYESITLMRLRQAEERKRLAQQLAQEDRD